ncbi:MAG: hypothetical protein R6V07_02785 [Armatimonadota bacterium]
MAVFAVLFLTLAASAHAFTVDIIEPVDDQCVLAVGRSYDFEAVAYDSLQQDITGQVTWSWDFDDGSDPDDDNPTTHTFDDAETLSVTVSGTWNAQQAQDAVTIQALPEWLADSLVYVRPAGATHLGYGGGLVFDGEVCDAVEVVWETDQIDVHSARFYVRNPDDSISWISDEEQPDVLQPRFHGGQGPDYEQAVSPEIMTAGWFPNQTKTYGVRIGREYGTPDGPEWEYFDRDIPFTSNNTAVPGNTGLIIHTEGAAPHEINWTIDHHGQCAVQDPVTGAWSWGDPLFEVTVQIRDLAGDVQATIPCGSANGVGDGSTTWNGGTEYGIYTYHVSAEHTQSVECSDQDKSSRLTISNASVSDFEWVDLPTEAQVTLGYQLNRNATNCRVRVFNHDLDEVTVTAPAGGALSNTAGTHSLTVEFEDPDQIVGHYRFVVFAEETAQDGALNRDEQPKPALAKGAAVTQWPRAHHALGQNWAPDGGALSRIWDSAGATSVDGTRYAATVSGSNATVLRNAMEESAIVLVVSHGWAGVGLPLGGWTSDCVRVEGAAGQANIDESDAQRVHFVENMDPAKLTHIRFIFLVSCQSMRTCEYHSLQQEFLNKGVGAVAGFHENVSMSKSWEYADSFYAYAHDGVGGLGYPLSIAAAHTIAIDEIASRWGDTFGLESFDYTANVDLRPARWGQGTP